jgi:hypothetical protein
MAEDPEKWKTVRVRKDLLDRVKKVIGEGELGYHTVSGFINDAVRVRLIDIELITKSQTPIESNENEGDNPS